MSKCRPTPAATLLRLEEKGVVVEDILIRPHAVARGDERREVVIRIPYGALLSDPEVQALFQDLVSITSED